MSGRCTGYNKGCHTRHIHWTLKKCNDPCISVLCQGQTNASSDLCLVSFFFFFFFVNLSCQRLNFHGFVLVVKICLTLSVPYIFIYKDVNIFISGRSVGSIGNGNCFFFIASRSSAGWYVFFFFYFLVFKSISQLCFLQSLILILDCLSR